MTVDMRVWRDVLCEAISTHVDEMSCAECYAQVDRLAELVLQNEDTPSSMPRVHDHLVHCQECREEFHALMSAVGATAHLAPP
jgi:predicted anti-sigma-YlaC factor YlaD